MGKIARGKGINRRQFLNKGLWAGICGLLAIFGWRHRSAKVSPDAGKLSKHEARFNSKLAG
jgi:hypothetical protein